jgi:hypothetical protein
MKERISRIESESKVIAGMIEMYCRKFHKQKNLCSDCQELASYAGMRLKICPFGNDKTFCSNCKVHCYKTAMREKIRKVMRFSGPRLLFRHPIMLFKHLSENSSKRQRKKL